MSAMSESGEKADRHARWVAMWRAAVRACPGAMGLIELSTTRFIELSRRAAELVGTTPEGGAGLNYLSVAERPREAADTVRLVREGTLDGLRARRRFRRPDGSLFEVESSAWAIRSGAGPDLGLWVAHLELSETDDAALAEEVFTISPSRHAGSELDGARVTLDDHWRLAHISANAGLLLGRAPAESLESSIMELAHPDDLAALLFAFARSTTETRVGVRVRLRHHDGSWRATHTAATALDGDGREPFALVVAAEDEPEASGSNSEVSKLAEHLRLVAAQIEAGVPVDTPNPFGFPLRTELSARQWEVVSRLVRGERVPTIAAEMYLSQSTVRNHLSAIFRKVGVHSQQEFLALWRRGVRGPFASSAEQHDAR